MGVTITQAASTLSVSEKTVRRRIKNGTLRAELVGDPPRYEIDPEELDSVQDKATQEVDSDQDNVYPALVQILQEQLQEKDRQIKELHILLQSAQEQTSRMLIAGNGHRKHWWWPFA